MVVVAVECEAVGLARKKGRVANPILAVWEGNALDGSDVSHLGETKDLASKKHPRHVLRHSH